MLDVKSYIQLVLKKKKLTYEEFCRRINLVKAFLGDKGIVRPSNISEILHKPRGLDEKTLLIMEVALELPMDSLTKLNKEGVEPSIKLRNKKLREVLRNARFNF